MSADKETIRAYCNHSKKWARKMRDGDNLVHKYIEKPAMYKNLPDLKNKSVLCVGCGTGEECDYLSRQGVKKIVGIDLSKGMLEYAKKSYSKIEFHLMDMDNMDFPDASFDLVYSSLAIHYIDDWKRPLKEIYRVLKKGGTFLFSTHHPVRCGAEITRNHNQETFLMGHSKRYGFHLKFINFSKKDYKIYGDYFNTRKIDDSWFNEIKVSYYHRSISSMMKDILESEFELIDFIEPKPIDSARHRNRAFWEIHQKIPFVIIFKLRK